MSIRCFNLSSRFRVRAALSLSTRRPASSKIPSRNRQEARRSPYHPSYGDVWASVWNHLLPVEKFDVISTYTREQALEDGVLADVSETAREAGIVFPVALTNAVWSEYVKVPDGVEGQDERGRLWDVLFMFRMQTRRSKGDTMNFQLLVRNDNRRGDPPIVTLKAMVGPGDKGEPVITIMKPNED